MAQEQSKPRGRPVSKPQYIDGKVVTHLCPICRQGFCNRADALVHIRAHG